MNSKKQKISMVTAIGLGVISAISNLNPASAAGVTGCGTAPSGATITKSGNTCQITFSAAKASSITLPSGVSELHGIVVGGGAGAGGVMIAGSTGYAGEGGQVQYFDFTGLADAALVEVEVGDAGVTGDAPTAGQPSKVMVTGQADVISNGGQPGSINLYCSFGGNYSTYVGNAQSGTGVAPTNAAGACDLDGAPGENPVAGAKAATWAGYPVTNLGKGGGVYGAAPTKVFPGEGGSAIVKVSDSTVTNTNAQHGIVVLRFTAAAPVTPAVQKSKKLITTFAGDKPTLTSAMKSDISKWIKKLPTDAAIVCKGSTSGAKITAFDKTLAKARATNVCNYAKKMSAGISYTITLNPSSANVPSARNVWMSFGY